MSYDLELRDPQTGKVIELDRPHEMEGCVFSPGGTTAELSVTYNYAEHFQILGDRGVRELSGKTGAESIPFLELAIPVLGDDVSENYWAPTEGNAKRALIQLLALSEMCPEGVWAVE